MSASLAGFAAEPITPRGMVAFAYGSFTRVWVTQFLVALVAAVSVLWFFDQSCAPTVKKAIGNLTGSGQLSNGTLTWRSDATNADSSPKLLAEDRVLGIVLDLNHSGQIHCLSDVQVEFGRDTIQVSVLPGSADFPYPDNFIGKPIDLSREMLDPFWGAWLPEFEAMLLPAVLLSLFITWNVVATVYWLPVWMLGFIAGRGLGFLASWRLAAAVLLPGGLLLALAFFLYGLGYLNLVQFAFVVCAHVPLAWLYLAVSFFFLPRRPTKRQPGSKNPFAAET